MEVNAQQHVGEDTAERTFRVCLYSCACVARLLTFAAQQSMLQKHIQTYKVIYGRCVYVTPFLNKDICHPLSFCLLALSNQASPRNGASQEASVRSSTGG